MKILSLVLCFCSLVMISESRAQSIDVDWFPIETEASKLPNRSRVIVTGKTLPRSQVRVDGETVTILRPGKNGAATAVNVKMESAEARSNAEGFFELILDFPEGSVQLPVMVIPGKNQKKTFLLTFDVIPAKEQVKMNTKTSNQKPPAAAKKIRLWAGAGWTYQNFQQNYDPSTDLKFSTVQAPGLVARAGYWDDQWGIDFFFRDAPGRIKAETPFQIDNDKYSWRILEAKGLYQLERNPKSRILGMASQWQVRFGLQMHQVPFLEIDSNNKITISSVNFNMLSLGGGLLLSQEQPWTYEFALGLQQPLSVSGPGQSFKASGVSGLEAQIGAAFKFAPGWRLGLFSYTQSLSGTFEMKDNAGADKRGKQNILSTTLDLRLGYEL